VYVPASCIAAIDISGRGRAAAVAVASCVREMRVLLPQTQEKQTFIFLCLFVAGSSHNPISITRAYVSECDV
jgi:hypothetical protein